MNIDAHICLCDICTGLGHGTEAREMTTNEAKPDSIECKKDDDCKQVCPDCKYKCNSPFCQCKCPPPPAATTQTWKLTKFTWNKSLFSLKLSPEEINEKKKFLMYCPCFNIYIINKKWGSIILYMLVRRLWYAQLALFLITFWRASGFREWSGVLIS